MVDPRIWVGVLALLGTACKQEQSPAEKARADREAVALVEAAQKTRPPPVPIEPLPVLDKDVIDNDMTGPGCRFVRGLGADRSPVFVAARGKGLFKLSGGAEVLVSDSGSTQYEAGARDHYTGKRFSVRLQRATGGSEATSPAGAVQGGWTGVFTIRDAYQRVVYGADGTLDCAATG